VRLFAEINLNRANSIGTLSSSWFSLLSKEIPLPDFYPIGGQIRYGSYAAVNLGFSVKALLVPRGLE